MKIKTAKKIIQFDVNHYGDKTSHINKILNGNTKRVECKYVETQEIESAQQRKKKKQNKFFSHNVCSLFQEQETKVEIKKYFNKN